VSRPCPHCRGDGHFVCVGGPGFYSERYGNWLPSERVVACEACAGEGLALDVEVLADRYEALRSLLGDGHGDPVRDDAELPF
jgi:hypothetical protein